MRREHIGEECVRRERGGGRVVVVVVHAEREFERLRGAGQRAPAPPETEDHVRLEEHVGVEDLARARIHAGWPDRPERRWRRGDPPDRAVPHVLRVPIVFLALLARRPTDEELPVQTHGNNLVEIIWTVIPTVIVLFLFFISWQTLSTVDAVSAQPDVRVHAIAGQFAWQFEYLDADGERIATQLSPQYDPDTALGGMAARLRYPLVP